MAKSNEPIVWSLFSAGGVLTALVIPALIVLLGFAEPLGLIKHDVKHIEGLLGHWLTKVFLVSLVCLAFFFVGRRRVSGQQEPASSWSLLVATVGLIAAVIVLAAGNLRYPDVDFLAMVWLQSAEAP